MNESQRNGLVPIIAQAIEKMEAEKGESIPLDEINLAELGRLTGLSRGKLRTLKRKGFMINGNVKKIKHNKNSSDVRKSKFYGYEEVINGLLRLGITNSIICLQRLKQVGFQGGLTIVKNYIQNHKNLVPAQRALVSPQGSRGRRYSTEPGECFQMDWGFTKALTPNGAEFQVACFAMVCHHCGTSYIEFFPNAKQENLFIGMLDGFAYMGVPKYILTDNMKSVVISRDIEGRPIWQRDYETFMKDLCFNTKLCKPRHPYTKGKVERLVRFVKDNFLCGRVFTDITNLNQQAQEWYNKQNNSYRKFIDGNPFNIHLHQCSVRIRRYELSDSIKFYLAPLRKITFNGYITYENRRFGIPYSYTKQFVRIARRGKYIYIYSDDLKEMITSYVVTWERRDRQCVGQYEELEQPEEFPTALVTTTIQQKPSYRRISFDKFNFDNNGDEWDE